MSVYQTKINSFGPMAEMFQEENMIVLFGNDAPEDLAEFTYNIDVNPVNGKIEEGMTVQIGGESYQITAVGNVVEKNLNDLGHITIKFDGATEADLAGTLYVEAKEMPSIDVGTEIVIK